MKFLDEAKIYIRSGDGGAGCVCFPAKNSRNGGPNGGNGGNGGNVIAETITASTR